MQNPMISTGLIAAALSAGTIVGCGSDEAADNQPVHEEQDAASGSPDTAVTLVNTVCPIMGGKAKATVTTQWADKTVGFCCAKCIPEWNALSDDVKVAKLASAETEAAGEVVK
jgi:hypothetical protein